MCVRMIDVMLFPGWSSLICASNKGFLHVVKHLVEHKANIEAESNDGMFLNSTTAVLSGFVYVWWLRVFT